MRAAAPRLGKVFLWLWTGQTLSILGSGLTVFALGVRVYQQTGSVNRFALVGLSAAVPSILFAPLLGALIDRGDRRRVLLASDCAAGLCTAGLMLTLAGGGGGAFWLLCLLCTGYGACGTVTSLALAAAVPLLVPDRALGRANGLAQLGAALAPLLGGVLLAAVGMLGILTLDAATFGVSIAILLVLRLPERPRQVPETSTAGLDGPAAITSPGLDGPAAAIRVAGAAGAAAKVWREAALGWEFVRRRAELLGLLALMAVANIAFILVEVLITPMILAFASPAALGVVLCAASLGMVGGSLLMAAWGGPRRRLPTLLWMLAAQGFFLVLGGLRTNLWWIGAGGFLFLASQGVMTACSQSLWQRKIPPHLAGRVLAVRLMLVSSALPAAYLMAGPLADRVFEPLMVPGGRLAASLGPLLGVGKGRGIGLLFIALGVLLLGIAAVAARLPVLRDVERRLPDALLGPA